MKFYIKTYGCQMNVRDSEALAGMLAQHGFEQVREEETADIILFNTCSVREQAERKAVGKIGFMKKLKLTKPNLIIGALGCMAQNKKEELLQKLPHLDFVVGTGELHTIVDVVEEILKKRKRVAAVKFNDEVLTAMDLHSKENWLNPFSAQIAITRGCNRFCSYCIVPYVRGREISRTIEDIVTEAKMLVSDGAKEIMLLGQNVAAFGLEGNLTPPGSEVSPFADLLQALDVIPGLARIRFTSPYPTYFNDKLIRTIAACPRVVNNIHLPLQSGSDRILKLMNHQYTGAEYLSIVNKLKKAFDGDVTFSTDIIVGFPTETEEDFKATRNLMDEVGFDQAYIFKYSPRSGTRSAGMEDDVSPEVKLERNKLLLADLEERALKSNQALVGTVQSIIAEGPSKRNSERWSGRTASFKTVTFAPEGKIAAGDELRIAIFRANKASLVGKIVEQ